MELCAQLSNNYNEDTNLKEIIKPDSMLLNSSLTKDRILKEQCLTYSLDLNLTLE